MSSKKKTKTSSTSHQEQKPLDLVMPGYNQIAAGISQGLGDIQDVQFTGDFIAQPGDLQNAMPGAWNTAAGTVGGLIPMGQEMLNMGMQLPSFADSPQLNAGMLSFASTNPQGMQGAVNAAIDPYMRQLTESVLPSLQSAGIESGAYGGSRSQATLPAMAIADAGEQAQRVAAALAYEDFQNQQARILQGYGLSTERGLGEASALTQRLSIQPELLNTVAGLAGQQAEYQGLGAQADLVNRQMAIDNALKQFQYDMTRPFMGYDVAANILSQMTAGYGTTDSTSKSKTTEKTGGLGNVVAGLGGLAAGIAGIPGIGSVFGGGTTPFAAPSVSIPQMPIYGVNSMTGWDPNRPIIGG